MTDVFISYASEDRPAVQALCSALEAEGIDVWFDRHELKPGDDWRRQIRRNVEDASCFVAVLSGQCLTSARREFRYEWEVAALEQAKAPPDRPFILPLVIDDVAETEPRLDPFRALQWTGGPGGTPSDDFVKRLRELVRAHRSPQVGRT